MLDVCTIWLCKTIYALLRLRGSHGAALPGLIAEKLRPNLIEKLRSFPEGVIVVSGTNGKTTTTSFIAQVLTRNGKKVFTNHSGSNMTRGLLSSIVRFSDWKGTLPYDVAVLEIDEAYASLLAPRLKPRASLLTNVLRDQLDRFGEIDSTAKLLEQLAVHTTDTVVYNVCDNRLARIKELKITANKVSYGFIHKLSNHFPDDDALYGQSRQHQKSAYTLCDFGSGKIKMSHGTSNMNITMPKTTGWHNTLNLTGAVALLDTLYGFDENTYSNLELPFGRGEYIKLKSGGSLTLQLVKNPIGFRVAMDVRPKDPALIIINDDFADGRDVSWLWDVDVARLASRKAIYCAGTRAYDMAVRLKYADIVSVKTSTDTNQCILDFMANNREGVVFLTYTSMMHARKFLSTYSISGDHLV
jgi:UDP-N-acetylmuramyl tripeptide synthase